MAVGFCGITVVEEEDGGGGDRKETRSRVLKRGGVFRFGCNSK